MGLGRERLKRLLKFKHSGIQPNRPVKILPFYQVMVFVKALLSDFTVPK